MQDICSASPQNKKPVESEFWKILQLWFPTGQLAHIFTINIALLPGRWAMINFHIFAFVNLGFLKLWGEALEVYQLSSGENQGGTQWTPLAVVRQCIRNNRQVSNKQNVRDNAAIHQLKKTVRENESSETYAQNIARDLYDGRAWIRESRQRLNQMVWVKHLDWFNQHRAIQIEHQRNSGGKSNTRM